MIRVLVLEDEAPARARLVGAIERFENGASVIAALPSNRSAEQWLSEHDAPDLVVADIELEDGRSFELFERVAVKCPVIFCTAFDEYVLEALASNGIDYLLKPINDARVHRALAKYLELRTHFAQEMRSLVETLRGDKPRYRRRLLVQRRGEFAAVPVADVAYVTTEHKLSVLVLRDGERHVLERSLSELAEELDPAEFFRLNRQYLVHVGAVARFSSVGKGRLEAVLTPPTGRPVMISQENARRFREWMDQ